LATIREASIDTSRPPHPCASHFGCPQKSGNLQALCSTPSANNLHQNTAVHLATPPLKNRLALAVATFVLLDLGTLAFSYSIARQVEKDAVAINLAGRQRMLSQRITKAALLAVNPNRSAIQRAADTAELGKANQTFRRTLSAFADGGETIGGDGRPVQLESVQGKAALLVGEVRGLLDRWPHIPTDSVELGKFSEFMDERNGEILDAMNQLTTELERESIASVWRLRIAQTLAFLLSLGNFLFILWDMHRARSAAEAASFTDALSGLLNRAGLYRELEAAIERSQVTSQPLGVMLLDLNDFKAVNDNFGHATGDATLREVARRLQDFRRQDWVCGRLGGDEFAIVCPDTTPESLAAAAHQLGRILGGIPAGGLTVSASVGWASVEGQQSADDVIAVADAKMYSVKNDRRSARSYRDKQR
jgi:diguanylate cyclase (GGDEF)-like protein